MVMQDLNLARIDRKKGRLLRADGGTESERERSLLPDQHSGQRSNSRQTRPHQTAFGDARFTQWMDCTGLRLVRSDSVPADL